MEKSKYEKPVVRNLDAVVPVQGSCSSGNTEITLGECISGTIVLEPCTTGTGEYPRISCQNGDFAGGGCWNGSDAG